MMKLLKPSLTRIRRLLKKIVFDPKKPGPMKIIAAMEDTTYYERRAQVLIEEARAIRLSDDASGDYEQRIIQAIQMLVLAGLNK